MSEATQQPRKSASPAKQAAVQIFQDVIDDIPAELKGRERVSCAVMVSGMYMRNDQPKLANMWADRAYAIQDELRGLTAEKVVVQD